MTTIEELRKHLIRRLDAMNLVLGFLITAVKPSDLNLKY